MSFVEGQRAAEDDEHTEVSLALESENGYGLMQLQTDESDGEPNGLISKPAKPHVRGFNSSSVRAPAGAAVYQLAKAGWDDFLQRAKVSEDINPQMREMGQGPNRDRLLSSIPPQEALSLLIQATGLVEQEAEPARQRRIDAEHRRTVGRERRRKRKQFPDPEKRVVINDLVCEGCGDCSVREGRGFVPEHEKRAENTVIAALRS